MRQEINDLKRKELFEYFDSKTNPFIILTTKIDITNIINYCKVHKNYYATIGYVIGLVANEMDCFKYRKEDDKIYKYDKLKVNFTQMITEDEIGFFNLDIGNNYHEFINNYIATQNNFLNQKQTNISMDQGEVWFSCAPWFDFDSLVTPFDKNVTVPQFIWGKFNEENNRVYTKLMILVHHGFVDGNHIGVFIKKLNDKIDRFNEIIK